tara:strand:+ start:201 stop:584 length:384 start_codon:yes stop_codon:yes gene_type:complete
MSKSKQPKLTQEELFPHGKEFAYRLEMLEPIQGLGNIAWYQCEMHLTKHLERYRITKGKIDVMKGAAPMSCDPFAPKRTRKASGTKASQTTKAKKPVKAAAKTTSTKRASKTAKKEVFSNLDTFFSK